MELNQHAIGLRPKGETWEWYTLELQVGAIHVHNKTPSGKWTYKITANWSVVNKTEYDTKEAAEIAAKKQMRRIFYEALRVLDE